MAAFTAFPRFAFAQSAPLSLTATTRVLEIDGKAATVYGLINGAGGQGLILDPGQRFRVDLTNSLDVDTIIHWHGQLPPNVQDGVPNLPMPLLKPAEMRSYDYAPNPGSSPSYAAFFEVRLLPNSSAFTPMRFSISRCQIKGSNHRLIEA